MSSKKRIAAVAITIAALTAGLVSLASADDAAGKGVFKTRVLAELVKAGTITQAQADAISKKLVDVKATMKANKADREVRRSSREAVVASALGIDAATIKSRMVAGETLAAIAGAKKDALITALVAFETTQIDAAVTAGKLTAARATKLKANLTKHVTAGVEKIKGPKGAKGPKAPRN